MTRPAFPILAALLALAFMTGCATRPETGAPAVSATNGDGAPSLFSANPPGGLPKGWEPLVLLRTKKPTEYKLVADQDRTVLHAKAVAASSALMHQISIDPATRPWLHWEWKVGSLVQGADNFQSALEDSPVRIVLGFDGDKDGLPFADQIMFETAKVLTGHQLPYATLMYIWENKAPAGTVIANRRSKRFQKIVAASGPEGIGQWRRFARNIVEDYEAAFGEKPGRLIGIGVLTDTDNTGETVEAWYGDIRLLTEREP